MASAITSQMLSHLYLGATIVIMHDIFLPNTFFSIVEAAKITNFTGVPPMILLMFEHRKRIHHDMSSLRFIGCCGSKIDSKNAKDFILSFPCIGFIIMYGQTEASTRITHLLPEDSLRKLGSAGTPIPGVKVKIINKNGAPVAQGEVGEIIVQGNNVMKGYYKRIEETNRTLVENWLYTGDLAYYDEEGYIYIVGRKKNVIISGGINIYPEEIEEVLMFNPAVKEVCIEGKKHNILGEVPIAKIVLHKEHIGFISENDIINYCFENISKYKIPTEVHFVDELNKTENGKVKRKQREVLL
jgi:long-chain acyl-CoA synthetase